MSATGWTAVDDGYLRAYEWSGALAAGTPLPREPVALPLNPGESAHLQLSPVGVSGFYGENARFRRSFVLLGGPVGLALTGAASLAYNAHKEDEARRAAIPSWHELGTAGLIVTSQRLVLSAGANNESFWHAESGSLQWAPGPRGDPAVQLQPAGMPLLRLANAYALLIYVFVHHLRDGRPPSVPLPPGMLARARAQGRLP